MKKNTRPQEIQQRFATAYPKIYTEKTIIWCHAVSLGETNTIYPILNELLTKGYGLWITSTTHTGYDRVTTLFEQQILAGDVYQSFVPVDDEKIVYQFIAHVQPIAALFVETELWANTLSVLFNQQIPSILVNGRLSEKSFQGYQKIAKVSLEMMENLSLIIAQDSQTAKRFRQLGATSDKIRLAHSLKWSSQVNPVMLAQAKNMQTDWQLQDRTIIVAGSTHQQEEHIVLKIFKKLQTQFVDKNLLLILIPRHPERFNLVADLIAEQGYPVVRRSQQQNITTDTPVFLADSMGELGIWYALADMALVGGSLVDIGGHNPIEVAIVGKPIIMGQFTQSCHHIVEQLKQVHALKQVADEHELLTAIQIWLQQPEKAKQAGEAGLILAEQYQTATTQQFVMILETIEKQQQQKLQNQLRLS